MNIGLQFYIAREECEKDFKAAIKKFAEIGYEDLKFMENGSMD